MSPTVHELRNEIRLAVGRFERVESTGFTKETLAAVREAVHEDGDAPPAKSRMRADILSAVGEREESEALDRSFRKAELQAIADALDA